MHDSLQLSAACGQPAVDRNPPALAQRRGSAAAASRTVYVSPNGDDTNTGADAAHPLKSLNRAVATIRLARACGTCGGPAQIFLAKGTYFIGSTLHLEPNDSGEMTACGRRFSEECCVLTPPVALCLRPHHQCHARRRPGGVHTLRRDRSQRAEVGGIGARERYP